MPKLSAFNPCGLLRMSSKPSYAKSIYDALIDGETGAFDNTRGSPREAGNYARAMGFARMRCAIERAGRQIEPRNCNDLLPDFEQRFGLVPGSYDTLTQRQDALAAKIQFAQGAKRSNMVAVLRGILGANFLSLHHLTESETYVFTPSGATRCVDVDIAPKFLQLTDPVSYFNGVVTGPIWIPYANLDTSVAAAYLNVGEDVTVQPGHSGLHETVTVLDVSGTDDTRMFKALFSSPHDIGAVVTTMNYPYEWSTRRSFLVVVNIAACRDAVVRAKIDEAMRQLTRVVDTWFIVEPSTPGALTVGPFTVGTSALGTTTIGTIPFTLEP